MIAEALNYLVYFGTAFLYSIINNPIDYLWHIVLGLLVFSLMVFFHEVAHGLVLHHYTKEKISFKIKNLTEIEVGTQEQIDRLTNKQYILVLVAGIVSGFFVLLAFADKFSNVGFLSMYFFYLWSCRSDLRVIFQTIKKR